MRDKPGKSPDAYHTCYNLSGAASATLPPVFSRPVCEQLVQSFQPVSNSSERFEDSRTADQDTGKTDAQQSCEVYGRSLAWQVGRSRQEDATKHEDLVRTLVWLVGHDLTRRVAPKTLRLSSTPCSTSACQRCKRSWLTSTDRMRHRSLCGRLRRAHCKKTVLCQRE